MKIVLFGEDFFSATALQSLIDNGQEILFVICPLRNNSNYKSLQKITTKNNILFHRVEDVNSKIIENKLIELKADLIISVHLKKILKKQIFNLTKYGAINVHPSLLPKYRGLSPQHQAIIHGDSETAVTIHFIEEGIDTGDFIIQERIPILKSDYIYDLQINVLSIYKHIFIKAIGLIEDPNFKPIMQSELGLSYFGRIKEVDRRIDLNKSKEEIYNQIRAFSMPYEGAFYDKYVIWRVDFIDNNKEVELIKKYPNQGIYQIPNEDIIIIRLRNSILVSDDFELLN